MVIVTVDVFPFQFDASPNPTDVEMVSWLNQTTRAGAYMPIVKNAFAAMFIEFRREQSLSFGVPTHFHSGINKHLDEQSSEPWHIAEIRENELVVRHASGGSREVPKSDVVRKFFFGDLVQILDGAPGAGRYGYVLVYQVAAIDAEYKFPLVHVVQCNRFGDREVCYGQFVCSY